MRPAQAAKVIGCTPHQVRWYIRHGRLKAKKTKIKDNDGKVCGYQYDVDEKDVREIRNHPSASGRQRGSKFRMVKKSRKGRKAA